METYGRGGDVMNITEAKGATKELADKNSEDMVDLKGVFDKWGPESANVLQRIHVRPRSELFTPLRVRGSPCAKALLSVRVTRGQYLDTCESFACVDSWTCRGSAHRDLERPWIGATTFIRKQDVKVLGCDSASDKAAAHLLGMFGTDQQSSSSVVGGHGVSSLTTCLQEYIEPNPNIKYRQLSTSNSIGDL